MSVHATDLYEAYSADITFTNVQGSNCGSAVLGNFTDQLEITWSQTSCYTAIYKFRTTAVTPVSAEVSPLVHIDLTCFFHCLGRRMGQGVAMMDSG